VSLGASGSAAAVASGGLGACAADEVGRAGFASAAVSLGASGSAAAVASRGLGACAADEVGAACGRAARAAGRAGSASAATSLGASGSAAAEVATEVDWSGSGGAEAPWPGVPDFAAAPALFASEATDAGGEATPGA
jgi:hypothetical protein